jgi:hypothetical protein
VKLQELRRLQYYEKFIAFFKGPTRASATMDWDATRDWATAFHVNACVHLIIKYYEKSGLSYSLFRFSLMYLHICVQSSAICTSFVVALAKNSGVSTVQIMHHDSIGYH